jgi:hypothetical protein
MSSNKEFIVCLRGSSEVSPCQLMSQSIAVESFAVLHISRSWESWGSDQKTYLNYVIYTEVIKLT